MAKVIATCLFFGGLALISYFLNTARIGSSSFTFLFIALLLSYLAFYGFDRLKELDIKNMRITLNEMKEVKKDVYAKAETVKELGEEIAELSAFNVTAVGRFAPPDLTEEILRVRNKIKSVLEMIGSDKNKIESITSQIDNTVLSDLKDDIARKVRDRILKSSPTEQATICEKAVKIVNGHHVHATLQVLCVRICEEVDGILKDYNLNNSGEILIQCLEKKGVPITEIIPLINRLDKFIKEKTL